MASNEHPDMSGNPCDDPIVCDQCGRDCNESDLYGSVHDEDKNFCRQQCVYDFEEGWESVPMESGVDLIAAERQRQISVKGWSAEHDDTHREGELAIEAALWATQDTAEETLRNGMCGNGPHRKSKPRIKQLAVAGALIAAEIDRLQRLEGKQ
jgi:hypothetical protein